MATTTRKLPPKHKRPVRIPQDNSCGNCGGKRWRVNADMSVPVPDEGCIGREATCTACGEPRIVLERIAWGHDYNRTAR